jgi:hypothetical protein
MVFVLAAAPAGAASKISADLKSFEEVPAISTPSTSGHFEGTINGAGTEITYTLTATGIEGHVTQSHIHFGQKGVNGGVTIFLCSNLGNGPAGTQTCPDADGKISISGTITSADVLAINSQGIPAGGIGEVVNAIKKGIAYANLHTDLFPGGEIRGQIVFKGKAKDADNDDGDDSN